MAGPRPAGPAATAPPTSSCSWAGEAPSSGPAGQAGSRCVVELFGYKFGGGGVIWHIEPDPLPASAQHPGHAWKPGRGRRWVESGEALAMDRRQQGKDVLARLFRPAYLPGQHVRRIPTTGECPRGIEAHTTATTTCAPPSWHRDEDPQEQVELRLAMPREQHASGMDALLACKSWTGPPVPEKVPRKSCTPMSRLCISGSKQQRQAPLAQLPQ